ncbi:hypothetical protein AB0O20_14205 [Streptomyces kronopolitis]|uniref:hypothetical protein n=1 Tax=Streptomyces kronopolitis TaxID=1612435 RepID=UPI003419342D
MLSVPDARITATVDVGPWLEQKVSAVLAHRTEVARGAAPGLIAGLPESDREQLLSTEWYIRHDALSAAGAQSELTV